MRNTNFLANIAVSIFCGFLGSLIGLHFFTPDASTVVFSNPSGGLVSAPAPGCEEDAANFCPDARPDEGGSFGCLLDFADQVSETCRAKLAPMKNRFKACDTEIKKFCPGTKVGRMRIPRCLRPHKKDLSPACLKVITP